MSVVTYLSSIAVYKIDHCVQKCVICYLFHSWTITETSLLDLITIIIDYCYHIDIIERLLSYIPLQATVCAHGSHISSHS